MSATVHSLPMTGFAPSNVDIAGYLRNLANDIEAGDWGGLRTVVMIVETDEGALHRATCGQIIDLARVIGLLTTVAMRAAVDG